MRSSFFDLFMNELFIIMIFIWEDYKMTVMLTIICRNSKSGDGSQ